jgi:hypothetical protein
MNEEHHICPRCLVYELSKPVYRNRASILNKSVRICLHCYAVELALDNGTMLVTDEMLEQDKRVLALRR